MWLFQRRGVEARDRLWYRVLMMHNTDVGNRIGVGGTLGSVWCKKKKKNYGISEWVHLGIGN